MQNLFPLIAPSFSITATATASTPVQLPSKQTTVRIVNEGPSNAYIAAATTQGSAVATVPSATPAITCTEVLAGEDCVFSLPDDAQYYISAITRTGTAVLTISQAEGQ